VGVGDNANIVHLIDFGLLKEYRDPSTRLHIPCNKSLGLTRTATFTSINSHLGLELGRRDDLESLAYILIYFLRGSLPWQGLKCGRDDQVFKRKQRISAHDLCHGLPAELGHFLEYVRSLSFYDKPDYAYLERLFMSQVESQYDLVFNWDVLA
jgi:serine/threonine protein kinase